jgi:hypothetical protein
VDRSPERLPEAQRPDRLPDWFPREAQRPDRVPGRLPEAQRADRPPSPAPEPRSPYEDLGLGGSVARAPAPRQEARPPRIPGADPAPREETGPARIPRTDPAPRQDAGPARIPRTDPAPRQEAGRRQAPGDVFENGGTFGRSPFDAPAGAPAPRRQPPMFDPEETGSFFRDTGRIY